MPGTKVIKRHEEKSTYAVDGYATPPPSPRPRTVKFTPAAVNRKKIREGKHVTERAPLPVMDRISEQPEKAFSRHFRSGFVDIYADYTEWRVNKADTHSLIKKLLIMEDSDLAKSLTREFFASEPPIVRTSILKKPATVPEQVVPIEERPLLPVMVVLSRVHKSILSESFWEGYRAVCQKYSGGVVDEKNSVESLNKLLLSERTENADAIRRELFVKRIGEFQHANCNVLAYRIMQETIDGVRSCGGTTGKKGQEVTRLIADALETSERKFFDTSEIIDTVTRAIQPHFSRIGTLKAMIRRHNVAIDLDGVENALNDCLGKARHSRVQSPALAETSVYVHSYMPERPAQFRARVDTKMAQRFAAR